VSVIKVVVVLKKVECVFQNGKGWRMFVVSPFNRASKKMAQREKNFFAGKEGVYE